MKLGRMPVWESEDKIRKQWLYTLVVVDVSYGLVTIVGKTQGPGQVLMREIVPMPWWGMLLTVAGVMILCGWSVRGGSLGAFAWGATAAASAVSIGIGTALSTTAPILPAFMAAIHALIIYEVGSGLDQDREQRQRGS